jgi:Ca2+-binding RTX toxin-like protein
LPVHAGHKDDDFFFATSAKRAAVLGRTTVFDHSSDVIKAMSGGFLGHWGH